MAKKEKGRKKAWFLENEKTKISSWCASEFGQEEKEKESRFSLIRKLGNGSVQCLSDGLRLGSGGGERLQDEEKMRAKERKL